MKRLIHSILSLCFILPALSYAGSVTLTTMNWPPFYAQELKNGGVITALVQESFKASGYESEIEFTTWTNALDTVKVGKKDALVGAYYSDERAQIYHYSIPIYTIYSGIIKMDGFPLDSYTSFETLDNYKLGKLDQALVGESFDAFPFADMSYYVEVSDALKALKSGEIDLYADNLSVAKSAAGKAGIDPATLKLLQPPIDQNDLFLIISKEIPNAEEIKDAFNAGLIKIQMDGTYDKILADYNQS